MLKFRNLGFVWKGTYTFCTLLYRCGSSVKWMKQNWHVIEDHRHDSGKEKKIVYQ